jgi:hypothetical protein
MKKGVKRSLVVLVVILFCLWMFNPSAKQFTRYIKQTKHSNSESDTNFKVRDNEASRNQELIEKGELQYDIMNRVLYNYKNYIFFSSCTFVDDRDTNYAEVRYSYIGIANTFMATGKTSYR